MADNMETDEILTVETERERDGTGILHVEASTLRDIICDILNSTSRLSSELNLGVVAVKVDANPTSIDVSSLQPAHVFTCLQQHISTLQSVSANLKHLLKSDPAYTAPSDEPRAVGAVVSSEGSAPHPEDLNVQIRACKSEIDRRISAFIERKQLEINENNVREFCNVIDCNQENSCARTDAVFTPFPGFKSHVKVTRVVNLYGPQTWTGGHKDQSRHRQSGTPSNCGNPAIEERLNNIEAHLKLPADRPVPLNIYQRLKRLEDRILELEGLSPEYFQATAHLHKRPKATPSQAYSLTELDRKINTLKATLLKKVSEAQLAGPEEQAF
ncbi:hypothetical protein MATL_G00263820 [Megalops atlanticus]|uniref:MAP3K12-binding inhibitory protein 1 n=1 Tax=Megalops atlanticus TaxID=7932 RepID=A0A9D3PBF8_MEGAT|nr:hypothetical protein MATL_G00263820 [Megalops atlanticus]